MEKDGITSVDDIDALLDNEFNINEGDETVVEDNDEVIEDNSQEDIVEDVEGSDNNDTTNQNDNVEENSTNSEKHTEDDKKEFAFAKFRKENNELKNELKGLREGQDFLKEIASNYGYDSVEEFARVYRDARIAQEAKEKGYDPVLYKQLQDSNRRIEQLEKENREAKLNEKANIFRNAIENAITAYDLGENGRKEIFNRLEEAGFSADELLSLSNPEVVIKGVLADKIAESSKQNQIKKLENLDNLADVKHNGNASTGSFSLDDIIREEMKAYKAENFY